MAHQNFEGSNIREYFERYTDALHTVLKKVDFKSIRSSK